MSSTREVRTLSEHIEQGHQLVHAATVVESQDDFRVWRADRNTWVWRTAEALEREHGPEIAERVRHGTARRVLEDGWSGAHSDEVTRVRRALKALYELGAEHS
jgi:hypothetical protein